MLIIQRCLAKIFNRVITIKGSRANLLPFSKEKNLRARKRMLRLMQRVWRSHESDSYEVVPAKTARWLLPAYYARELFGVLYEWCKFKIA